MAAPMSSCCCGFNVHVGSLIIGYLSLIYGLLNLLYKILGWSVASWFDFAKNAGAQSIVQYGQDPYSKSSPSVPAVEIEVDGVEATLCASNIILAVALIVLASMEKKRELKWWVHIAGVFSCIALLYSLVDFGIFKFISSFIGYFIDIYGLLVVYSYAVGDSVAANADV